MRKALYTSILILLAVTIYAQEKVTISGKVTVKDTGKPPIGIITIAEKGVVDYWAAGDNIGTNRHTFVEKDGSYKFTINKGGTITIWDGGKRYSPIVLDNLQKDQTIPITLKVISGKTYNLKALEYLEKNIDIHKRIKIVGKILFPDGKGMQNATIGQMEVYSSVTGSFSHTTSSKNGSYEYIVLKGVRIYYGAPGYESQVFTATKDTVINVKMMRVNPFK